MVDLRRMVVDTSKMVILNCTSAICSNIYWKKKENKEQNKDNESLPKLRISLEKLKHLGAFFFCLKGVIKNVKDYVMNYIKSICYIMWNSKNGNYICNIEGNCRNDNGLRESNK